jgi:hypothetical protein
MIDNCAERRLRRFAKASGFDFRKLTTSQSAANHGGLQPFEIETNRIVAGDRCQLDTKRVAIELKKLGVLGYEG